MPRSQPKRSSAEQDTTADYPTVHKQRSGTLVLFWGLETSK